MKMAKTYALIDQGLVSDIVTIQPGDPPLSERYHAAIVESAVELQGALAFTVKPGWLHDGSGFSQRVPEAAPIGPRYVPVATIRERLEAQGKWEALVAILQADMPTMMKVLTLRDGVAVDDQQARGLIAAAGADPDEILAP